MIAQIEALAPRYPNRRALTLPALHIVHAALRQVPLEAVVEIAEVLGPGPGRGASHAHLLPVLPRQAAWQGAGLRLPIDLLRPARGGDHLLEHLCRANGVKPYGTTPDGELTIEPAECLGACDFAPCILANDDLLKNLDARVRREGSWPT